MPVRSASVSLQRRVVSLDDLLRVLATELAYLVETVNRSTEREVASRPSKFAGA